MASQQKFPRLINMTRHFFQMEAAAGVCLMVSAALALIVANSPLVGPYQDFFGTYAVKLSINDGLMAIFFFLVGLEIKREIMVGELSSRDRALLPVLAAVGGMAVPAGIYWLINRGSTETLSGWAIPSATDIAFSLGVLALLGSRVPLSLKILLTAIAIIDDLGAVVIIALFYTSDLSVMYLGAAAGLAGLLLALNRGGCSRVTPFLLIGCALWFAMYKSGIHPTIAGVLTAFAIPLTSRTDPERKPLERLEHLLHPYVAFLILPIFAFANAGVPLEGMSLSNFGEPVVLGITLGLFAGKLIGIFAVLWLVVKIKLCPMPFGVRWTHLWGLAHLCGIGFTMSLFIGELAFQSPHLQADIRLGVLAGSIISALAAYAVLRFTRRVDLE